MRVEDVVERSGVGEQKTLFLLSKECRRLSIVGGKGREGKERDEPRANV
jgi:hypothetical protein